MRSPGWKRPDIAINIFFGALTVVGSLLIATYMFGSLVLSIQEVFKI